MFVDRSVREVYKTLWEASVLVVLKANEKSVAEVRAGKDKAFNALVGQVMKASQGKANPAQAGELLKKKLAG